MAQDPLDLSGRWDGVFDYPGGLLPTTPFLAEIDETGGGFAGTVIEPDWRFEGRIEARIAGVRAGMVVDFTKTYLASAEGYDAPVDYTGRLTPDGETITGSWTMQEWSGTFEMTRHSRTALAEKERAEQRA